MSAKLVMRSRRRLVVHAGTPKNGSTTIQRALAALDPHLRERGIHVPEAARDEPGVAWHANLRREVSGFRHVLERGGWRALTEEVRASDARLFVISDETFGQRPPSGIHMAIAELAARCGLEVDVVAYVRPQCQYLESLYAEHVKIGLLSTPFEVCAAVDFAGGPVARHPWLDYGRAFAPWRAAFGDRVAVTPFEPSRLPGGLVAHFLGLLGCGELAGAVPDIRANTRVGAKELEVRRLTTLALRRAGRRDPWQALERLHGLRGAGRRGPGVRGAERGARAGPDGVVRRRQRGVRVRLGHLGRGRAVRGLAGGWTGAPERRAVGRSDVGRARRGARVRAGGRGRGPGAAVRTRWRTHGFRAARGPYLVARPGPARRADRIAPVARGMDRRPARPAPSCPHSVAARAGFGGSSAQAGGRPVRCRWAGAGA